MKMNNKGQSPKKGFFGSSSKISILPIVIILIISAIGFYLLFNDIYLGQETEKPNYCDNHDNIRQEDPYIFTNPTKIENSNGNAWDAIAENIQLAINDLGALGGDVWVPPGEYDVFENIEIYSDGTRIHGSGDSTLFILHDDSKIYSNDNDDILIENFKVTGSGKIWLILGDNTFVRDINAYNITAPWDRAFTFFNFMLTNGMDRSGLLVENCHVNRCTLSGFMIYAELPGSVLEDICFDNCSANYCGWDVDGTPQQSPWSVGFVFNECKNHPDFHIRNLTVRNCVANYNWESGFHFEYAQTQSNCKFYDCQANYNGQKLNYVTEIPDEYFCSGFLNIKSGVSCYNCEAIGNTAFGFRTLGGSLHDCIAYGNGMKDFSP